MLHLYRASRELYYLPPRSLYCMFATSVGSRRLSFLWHKCSWKVIRERIGILSVHFPTVCKEIACNNGWFEANRWFLTLERPNRSIDLLRFLFFIYCHLSADSELIIFLLLFVMEKNIKYLFRKNFHVM